MFTKPFTWIKKLEDIEERYTGIVQDNNDPLKLQRVKVRFELFGNIPTEHLPWYNKKIPSGHGSGLGAEEVYVPEIGSKVEVYFLSGRIYFGTYSHSVYDLSSKSGLFDEEYPNVYGQVDSSGNYFKGNRVTNELKLHQQSGSETKINEDSSIESYHKTGTYSKLNEDGSAELVLHTGEYIKLWEGNIEIKADNIKLDGSVTITGSTHIEGTLNTDMTAIFASDTYGGGIHLNGHIHGVINHSVTTPPENA